MPYGTHATAPLAIGSPFAAASASAFRFASKAAAYGAFRIAGVAGGGACGTAAWAGGSTAGGGGAAGAGGGGGAAAAPPPRREAPQRALAPRAPRAGATAATTHGTLTAPPNRKTTRQNSVMIS